MNYTTDNKCDLEKCQAKCCSSILPLNQHEIDKIKKYIARNNIKSINRNSNKSNDKYIDICPFLNEELKCNIYIHRPSVCHYYMCNGSKEKFINSDKHLVNMNTEFFPDEECYNAPLISVMDYQYQEKKKKAGL